MLLGIGGLLNGGSAEVKFVRASTNAGAGNCLDAETRICPEHGKPEQLQMDFDGTADFNINAFEGCCVTANHYYAVCPKHKATNDYTTLTTLNPQQRWCRGNNESGYWVPCNKPGAEVPIP